ncbi:hypothetical protein D3C80_1394110 [compost metagenome]
MTARTIIVLCLRFVFVVFVAGRFGFCFEQCQTIGNRDLIIIRMDFRESEEAMAITAIFHERSLKRRFDAGNACEINITL